MRSTLKGEPWRLLRPDPRDGLQPWTDVSCHVCGACHIPQRGCPPGSAGLVPASHKLAQWPAQDVANTSV